MLQAYSCEICSANVTEVIVCAFCQLAGHEACIQPGYLEGYAFCRGCLPRARAQWAQMQLAQDRERWTSRISQQIIS